jgi:hypothetical protein
MILRPKNFLVQLVAWLLLAGLCFAGPARGATLTGSFASLAAGNSNHLSTEGTLDWVHWGFYTESSLNRKASVPPLIGDFTVVGSSNAFLAVYKDNGTVNFSWRDGEPARSATNTTALVWVYGFPEIGAGFQLVVPADTTVKTLKLYVGVFAARGRLTARLSDAGAPAYTNTTLVDMLGSWKGGVYTINFAAASPGQSLIIDWTLLLSFRADGNVTLEAATLSSAGANNPPFAAITAPAGNAKFAAPANLTIEAQAEDYDGTVTRVEFFDGATKLGEATASPYSFAWNNAPPGYHALTARATDNLGASRSGPVVDVFVHTTGGSLAGSVAAPPGSVDLTAEGTADWTHWGLSDSNSFDRKRVSAKISDFTLVGTHPAVRYTNNAVRYSWNDGTPTAAATGTDTGVYVTGFENAFELAVAADTTPRRLKVYVSLYGAQGNFQACLSDASAPAFTDTSLNNFYGDSYGVYTLDYAAASPGQTLLVRYRTRIVYDMDFGNVTLQSATLAGGNRAPFVIITSPLDNASFPAQADITIMADASDTDGTISKVEFFQGATKLGQDTVYPYSFTWNQVPTGTYSLTVRATDNGGETFTSVPVGIVVGGVSLVPVTLLDPGWGGGAFRFSFATEPGRSYLVQFNDSLATSPSTWQTLTNVAGTGATVTVTDTGAGGGPRFYLVETR